MSDAERDTLIRLAWEKEVDIATATYLAQKICPEADTPAQLITWISQLVPSKMEHDADRLAELTEAFKDVNAVQIERLYDDDGWTGPAGSAFEERWRNDLLNYVGEETQSGRITDFEATEKMLRNVANAARVLQQATCDYIEGDLKDLRKRFEEACEKDADAEAYKDWEIGANLVAGMFKMAASGATPLEKGADAIALVVNAVFQFINNTVTTARDTLAATLDGAKTATDTPSQFSQLIAIDYHPYRRKGDVPYE